MKFKRFILEENINTERWNLYLKEVPMLSGAVDILNMINKKGYKTYIVGGCVRDLVLGKKPKDIDIATNAPVKELEKLFPKTYDIGKSKDFGIIVIRHNGFSYEVAQFRTDGEYLDGRKPESVEICQNFKEDASRRDFCINAMGIDSKGNIIDYFDGQKDIKDKIIRTVGNPYDRFKEDHLRMMRAVRFSSKLGFKIHPETKQATKELSKNITKISSERIREELIKMASDTGSNFADAIVLLDEVGILEIILPEIVKLKEFKHNKESHPEGDTVYDHILSALRSNKVVDPLVNLSILFHDIGKQVTYQEIDGKHTYRGHAEEGRDLIYDIAKKLKLTNEERDAILFSMINHMRFHDILDMKKTKILELIKDKNFAVLRAVAYADSAARKELFDEGEWRKILDKIVEVETKWGTESANKLSNLVNGDLVMKLTGLKPGKQVGDIIRKVSDYIVQHNITDGKEIEKLIKELNL
jgi:tRNA nucleotidyltransferase/poly(A) polymerase